MAKITDPGRKLRALALPLAVATLVLSFVPCEAHAREQIRAPGQEPAQSSSLEGVSAWMKDRFSEAEIEALSPGDLGMESHFCSCADEPDPHFPYMVVLFTTPKGDLVARAEAQEHSAKFTPLAVRNGDEYCNLESHEPCYGSFATVCEFTDFRYGPSLEPFFPTCK